VRASVLRSSGVGAMARTAAALFAPILLPYLPYFLTRKLQLCSLILRLSAIITQRYMRKTTV
jgi:hypothetical protein